MSGFVSDEVGGVGSRGDFVLSVNVNLCFSGCWSWTRLITWSKRLRWSFNPCFSGCWSWTFL